MRSMRYLVSRVTPAITFLVLSYWLAFQMSDGIAAPPAIAIAPEPRPLFRRGLFGGVVRDVDKASITIQGLEVFIDGATHVDTAWNARKTFQTRVYTGDNIKIWGSVPKMTVVRAKTYPDGIVVTEADGKVTELMRSNQPTRRYGVCEALEMGAYANDAMDSFTYPLSDVQVGDIVSLQFIQSDWHINIVHGICIKRRPGGSIPPVPGEDPKLLIKFHERMQARQDWEEKGIPFPMKLLSPMERLERTAPPPRPVERPK